MARYLIKSKRGEPLAFISSDQYRDETPAKTLERAKSILRDFPGATLREITEKPAPSSFKASAEKMVAFRERAVTGFQVDMLKLSKRLDKRLQTMLREYVGPDGRYTGDTATLVRVAAASRQIEKAIVDSGYARAVKTFLNTYPEAARMAVNAFRRSGVPQEFLETDIEMLRDISRAHLEQFQALGVRAKEVLREELLDLVSGGGKPEEVGARLRDVLLGEGTKDKAGRGLYRHASTIANTALAQFQRQAMAEIGDELGVNRWLYYGGLIATSRPFCIERNGKTYTRAQIDRMENGQIEDVFTSCGGYNCRHEWLPVFDDQTLETGLQAKGERKPRKPKSLKASRLSEIRRSSEFEKERAAHPGLAKRGSLEAAAERLARKKIQKIGVVPAGEVKTSKIQSPRDIVEEAIRRADQELRSIGIDLDNTQKTQSVLSGARLVDLARRANGEAAAGKTGAKKVTKLLIKSVKKIVYEGDVPEPDDPDYSSADYFNDSSDQVETMERVFSALPERTLSTLRKSSMMPKLLRISDGQDASLHWTRQYTVLPSGRRKSREYPDEIELGIDADAASLLHEMTHILEVTARLQPISEAFIERMDESVKWEDPQPSSMGLPFFDPNAQSPRERVWIDPYAARIYQYGMTELFTVGMETLGAPEYSSAEIEEMGDESVHRESRQKRSFRRMVRMQPDYLRFLWAFLRGMI